MIPLLSIIVPVYNVAPYLSNCLDSILAQTYKKIEIVIVDDGSRDDSGEIADRYARNYSDKIKCIHIENSGVTNARLKGISVANGEWIGFVDGDDEIESDMYERLINNAIIFNSAISHCGYQTIVNKGERIHYFYNSGVLYVHNQLQGLKELLKGTFIEPSLCNKIYHKSLFDQLLANNILDRSIRVNEDLLMNYLLFSLAQKTVYEDFCAYHYLVRNSSVSRSGFQAYKCLDPVHVMRWICTQCNSELREIAIRKYVHCCSMAYITLYNKKDYKAECMSIRNSAFSYKVYWRQLSFKERIKLYLIFYLPDIYKIIYAVYARYFQKKVYE